MIPWKLRLAEQLGKQAGDARRKTKKTVRSKSIGIGTPEGRSEANAALHDDLKPASHVAPTRYGRKPYSSGMMRDSA